MERIELRGRPWLFYHAFPLHAGLIRASVADPLGNLSMCEEAVIGEVLPIAQAVRNNGGIVLAQVRRLTDQPLPPHQVSVPGILVDRIVLSRDGEHDQTFGEQLNPVYFSPPATDSPTATDADVMPMSARRIIAARACDELRTGDIANLGIGMPGGHREDRRGTPAARSGDAHRRERADRRCAGRWTQLRSVRAPGCHYRSAGPVRFLRWRWVGLRRFGSG